MHEEELESQKEWKLRTVGGAVYFLLQGLGAGLWWLMMWWFPLSRGYFRTSRMSEQALLDFAWPDIPLVVFGSLFCAWALWKVPKSPWTQRLVWAMVGITFYPTLYVAGATLMTGGEGWAATMAMGAAAGGSGLVAWTVRPDGPLFREAVERSSASNVSRTALQSAFFWLVSLVITPWLILQAEKSLGIPSFQTPFQSWLPWLLFVPAGLINLYSGYTMSRWGKGTPLPMDTARLLVVRGPYRFIRNPMATSGIFLGLMVGWWLGSWGTLLAAFSGGVFWHVFVRPIEETDLLKRFGEPYKQYQSSILCWLPIRKPYERLPKDEIVEEQK